MMYGDQWLDFGLRIRRSRQPLSKRLAKRLRDNPILLVHSKPNALKYCANCQMSKPDKLPYYRPKQNICRACSRRLR